MSLHPETFDFLAPTEAQIETMAKLRAAFSNLAHEVDDTVRPGEDKQYILRLIRTAAVWTNIAITRDSDGAPR